MKPYLAIEPTTIKNFLGSIRPKGGVFKGGIKAFRRLLLEAGQKKMRWNFVRNNWHYD